MVVGILGKSDWGADCWLHWWRTGKTEVLILSKLQKRYEQHHTAANYSKETEILSYYVSSINAKMGILALNPHFLSEQQNLDLVLFHTES